MTIHFSDAGRSGAPIKAHPAVDFQARDTRGPAGGLYRSFGKRALDILFVLLVAPMALILIAVAALLTALDGHNPFYFQPRVGRHGRTFWLVKIRSMVTDADEQLAAYLASNPEARREWDDKQKLDNDPRITRVGHFLRRSSLDELPQLWNVLTGDMSVVGPRPMMVEQQEIYPGKAYYDLRPGITGAWQVSDRNECSFAGRARFDNEYNAQLSLKLDLDILFRTAGVVLKCTGK
ncbi:sugar transferase [Psychromarinibacter sp. S121]|uniref:sugar transferase n=1 Tax=Psychromarinibacter sp. S121 TaxID=3415127 RepID=UPI003C7ACD6F